MKAVNYRWIDGIHTHAIPLSSHLMTHSPVRFSGGLHAWCECIDRTRDLQLCRVEGKAYSSRQRGNVAVFKSLWGAGGGVISIHTVGTMTSCAARDARLVFLCPLALHHARLEGRGIACTIKVPERPPGVVPYGLRLAKNS